MAKRTRDYAAEYRRRIERALQKGYSRSVARGHAKKGELSIKRAKEMHVRPGHFIEKQGRHGTIANPWRPTYAQIRARCKRLGLPLSGARFKGKRGKIPINWIGPVGNRRLIEDDDRDNFIEFYTGWGLTEHEAYTLWFSP